MEDSDSGVKPSRAGRGRESLSDSAVNLSAAALTWLFGVLVFLPMARRIDPRGLTLFLSLIIFSAFTLFLIKGLKGLGAALDAASMVLSHEWSKRRELEEEQLVKMRERFKVALRVAALIILYLLYSPLLLTIHPAINGIALIITLLGIIWILARKEQ